MKEKLRFYFSHKFDGSVWNTLAIPEKDILLLEVRNHTQKRVAFSALNTVSNSFLWRDKVLEEPWWVSMSAVVGDIILFTIYLDTSNPDKKGILAYDLKDLSLRWWKNDFSLISISEKVIEGHLTNTNTKGLFEVQTGKEVVRQAPLEQKSAAGLYKPQQYSDDIAYFNTVKTFLQEKINLMPVLSLEYLEHEGLIIISYYVTENGLANYLLVLSVTGDVILHEKLAEQLKGVGTDTFFVLGCSLIFVKNKCEVISYSIL